jgi:hypothetical protein
VLELSERDYEEEVVMSVLMTCTTVTIRSTRVNFLKFLQSELSKQNTWHTG